MAPAENPENFAGIDFNDGIKRCSFTLPLSVYNGSLAKTLLRELLSSVIITIDYVKSQDNVSDPPTKPIYRRNGKESKGMDLRPRISQQGSNSTSRLEIPRASFKEIKQSWV
ncbi:hypothetical protein CQW23_17528 [Capsicum baccatum]|uniref:Uncharacterized protein n=1 Tax=Capsicum baccatum TaxID=33114 RepID=A0A2G2WE20_CAPBA|nr:hypothetical protein CQW23_17528 [Capsicum baccatum]